MTPGGIDYPDPVRAIQPMARQNIFITPNAPTTITNIPENHQVEFRMPENGVCDVNTLTLNFKLSTNKGVQDGEEVWMHAPGAHALFKTIRWRLGGVQVCEQLYYPHIALLDILQMPTSVVNSTLVHLEGVSTIESGAQNDAIVTTAAKNATNVEYDGGVVRRPYGVRMPLANINRQFIVMLHTPIHRRGRMLPLPFLPDLVLQLTFNRADEIFSVVPKGTVKTAFGKSDLAADFAYSVTELRLRYDQLQLPAGYLSGIRQNLEAGQNIHFVLQNDEVVADTIRAQSNNFPSPMNCSTLNSVQAWIQWTDKTVATTTNVNFKHRPYDMVNEMWDSYHFQIGGTIYPQIHVDTVQQAINWWLKESGFENNKALQPPIDGAGWHALSANAGTDAAYKANNLTNGRLACFVMTYDFRKWNASADTLVGINVENNLSVHTKFTSADIATKARMFYRHRYTGIWTVMASGSVSQR